MQLLRRKKIGTYFVGFCIVLCTCPLIFLHGCGTQGGSSPKTVLQIYAANSLAGALEEAQAIYLTQNPEVIFADTQFKGSGELNAMLTASNSADILISASVGKMDAAVEQGSINESSVFNIFANELVIVAKSDSGLSDVSIEDIAAGEYTVAVGDESVPAGNYAAQALSTVGTYVDPSGKNGAEITGSGGSWTGISPVLDTSVGNVCAHAQAGQVDVAIVYLSDVQRFAGVEIVGSVPANTYKPLLYPAGICVSSANAAQAQDFLEWACTNSDALMVWQKWGLELV